MAGHITKDLHGGAITLGLVYAADGLSVVVATALAARLSHRRHLGVYASAYVVQGVAWALTFAANSLALAVMALVVMRLASGYVIALDTTILLETVPPRLRGRIVSLHMTTYSAVARISLAAVGAALTALSISTIGMAAGVASAGFGVVWWRRSGRPARTLYQTHDAALDPGDGLSETMTIASSEEIDQLHHRAGDRAFRPASDPTRLLADETACSTPVMNGSKNTDESHRSAADTSAERAT